MLESVLNNYGFHMTYLKMLLEDIPEEQMCEQPAGVVNHPAWQIGHLAAAAHFGVSQLGGEVSMPDGWGEKYGRGSTPEADRAKYPSKAELLAECERSHKLLSETLAAATPETLAGETPDGDFRQVMPTVSDAIVFITLTHSATHLGQISVWRRVKGLPGVLG